MRRVSSESHSAGNGLKDLERIGLPDDLEEGGRAARMHGPVDARESREIRLVEERDQMFEELLYVEYALAGRRLHG